MENIAIISYPISLSFITPLSNLISVVNNIPEKKVAVCISECYNQRIVFSPETSFCSIPYASKEGAIQKVMNYLKIEILIANYIIRGKTNIDKIIFFMEGDALLPSIVARFLGIPILKLLPSGIVAYNVEHCRYNKFDLIVDILQKIGNLNVNAIGIYGERLVGEWNLQYLNKKKIRIISEHLVDTDLFNITIPYSERKEVVAYIGRLSPEKGIESFIKSIPEMLDKNPSIRIIVIGSGSLQKETIKDIERINADDRIELIPWVDHLELPKILNQLKLLVIPSFTEGIPNIMLEAMACGTPVLSNSVGAIPDIITNGENGFLMNNNNPEEITSTVLQCLQNEDIEKISMNASITVKRNYDLKSATIKWEKILESI